MAALSVATSLTAAHNNVNNNNTTREEQSDTVDESTSLNIEMKHEDEEQETVMEGCVVDQQDEEQDNFKPTDTDDSMTATTTDMVSCILYIHIIYIQTLWV